MLLPGMTMLGLATMPQVTDWAIAPGLPMAKTRWPVTTLSESPHLANGKDLTGWRMVSGRSLMIAMSVNGSVPINSASTRSRPGNVHQIFFACPTT